MIDLISFVWFPCKLLENLLFESLEFILYVCRYYLRFMDPKNSEELVGKMKEMYELLCMDKAENFCFSIAAF